MPDWIWLPAPLFRYRDKDTGQFASADDVYDWGLISIREAQDDARLFAGLLADGSIDVGEWERRMRDVVKGEYVRQYLLGRGGREQMVAADYGSIGGMLAEQYGWLDDFAAEIAAGELSEAQIAQRADMYLNSSREAFERAKERAQKEETKEMRWNLTAAESCPDCVKLAGMGWQPTDDPFGTTPGAGATRCKTNCMCHVSYR